MVLYSDLEISPLNAHCATASYRKITFADGCYMQFLHWRTIVLLFQAPKLCQNGGNFYLSLNR